MAETRLPVIHALNVSNQMAGDAEENQGAQPMRKAVRKQASSFLSRLQVGHLQPLPRPGDIYHNPVSPRHPRPLGLIPGRNDRLIALKKLNQLLSPWSAGQSNQIPLLVPGSKPSANPDPPNTDIEQTDIQPQPNTETTVLISATVRPKDSAPPSLPPSLHKAKDGTSYRLSSMGLSDTGTGNMDPDYMGYMGDKASQYYAFLGEGGPLPTHKPAAAQPMETTDDPTAPLQLPLNNLKPQKQAKLKGYDHVPVSSRQYLNFAGQAHLFHRSLTEDKREAAAYEPCERCRLRGGRCARCKVLRTGGGYIILDGGESDWRGAPRRGLGDFRWRGGGVEVKEEGRGRRRRRRKEAGEGEVVEGNDGEEGVTGGGARQDVFRGGERSGKWGGDYGGWGGSEGNDGGGLKAGGREKRDDSGGGWTAGGSGADVRLQRVASARKDVGGWDGVQGREGSDITRSTPNTHHTNGGGDGEADMGASEQGGEGLGRQSHASRPGSKLERSRPGSKMGHRPGSSLDESSQKGDRGRRTLAVTSEKEDGGVKVRRRKTKGGEESSEEEERTGKRRRGTVNDTDEEGGQRGHREPEFNFKRELQEEKDEKHGYHGNLRKFKRKRDDVKALHATMKELQGIDPLDYLAKYCIIDQSKLPHYQHVYNNVDRDEDDEIDIGELDFALKAVNYDLISDSEMNYVHSVLELAGRYKLNFRLFSLIAALSEKVVALEDMVKRLINKMDFDALEVKMKKCKELFYLLADDAASDHEGGVVTTGSLAVELQAGGLTQEHVEFVVDRLNHEGKGLVEFLDYLTYVPLFVEIHDAISGNPLDFTRTK